MFSTAVPLMDAPKASPDCGYGDYAGGLSEALVPIALSLLVASLACGGFHFLGDQVETFDVEMRLATLDLLNNLVRRRPGCEYQTFQR
jgi:hypothetical protein